MKAFKLILAGLLLTVATAGTSAATHLCGNGVTDENEECDGGPAALFLDGDPASGACENGENCYFEFTCCKFNCQYVGTPGARCQDGNNCTGPDTCDQVGVCHGGPNAANDTPCDDGSFCNGEESCQDGVCLANSGPCGSDVCRACDEVTDSCLTPAGIACEDAHACISGGSCDGAGNCVGGVNNTDPCNDGIFCNGIDSCSGGGCNVHSGDPCAGSDGDGDCSESCSEASATCLGPDPDGADCDDALFCNGADHCSAGVCSSHSGDPCEDPTGCHETSCDEAADFCDATALPDGTVCSDGNRCTREDVCDSGVCAGSPPLLEDLCPWTVVIAEHPKSDLIKAFLQTAIEGDVCGGTVKFSYKTTIESDLVSAETDSRGALRLAYDAAVGDDIVSAGGGAKGLPASDSLPHTSPAVSRLDSGTLLAKPGGGTWDLTGTHPLASACIDARGSFASIGGALDALPATQMLPEIRLASGEVASIEPTVVGGLNFVRVNGVAKLGKDAVLSLSGGGDPNTVVVLRVTGKLQLLLRARIETTDGLTPEHTLIYASGHKCFLGDEVTGGGTLLCSPGRVKTRRNVGWDGVLYGAGRALKLGEKTTVRYVPFEGF